MKQEQRRSRVFGFVVLWSLLAGAFSASAQIISGQINNGSLWRENITAPPGNGDGAGQMVVGIWDSSGNALGNSSVTNGALPFLPGPYAFSLGGALIPDTYTVIAWIDGNENSEVDDGEPYGRVAVVVGSNSVGKVRINLVDDNDLDGIPQWWEYHWFQYASDPFAYTGDSDPDGDGLTNLEEYRLAVDGYGFDYLSPANWDTDGDGMDDGWECRYFDTELYLGMNPVATDASSDFDGDGLSNWQEYC
ncbi:MAG: hypothetical protein WCO77_09790, partial [bacterium]